MLQLCRQYFSSLSPLLLLELNRDHDQFFFGFGFSKMLQVNWSLFSLKFSTLLGWWISTWSSSSSRFLRFLRSLFHNPSCLHPSSWKNALTLWGEDNLGKQTSGRRSRWNSSSLCGSRTNWCTSFSSRNHALHCFQGTQKPKLIQKVRDSPLELLIHPDGKICSKQNARG